ncbi:Adenine phosphoribosyltransferase [Trichinella papuae]|uniref:adenine phosphoribosyltransferase n=1 Tax=Trichinella papuae TaxID=268474 RepID=A0A0V1MRE8_9BILA|nr:Adenine phosphoribosyltransferase [Trichinella papuae]
MLSKIKILRAWIPYPVNRVRRIELHIFGDASQTAYAACAYIRVESMDHQMSANLVISKNRVAPLRQISLPRLELMAALLCARLKKYLEKELTLPIQETICWSDSRVALAWIKGVPARWKPFVANRVQEIQESASPKCGRYCPTKENPADIPSRGCSLDTLTNSVLWWHGPPWLMQTRDNWPDETSDNRRSPTLTCRAENCESLNRQYKTLIRVTAYCLRFARNCQSLANERMTGVNLSVKEIWNAEVRWLREVQVKEFGVKSDSAERVKELEPFLDQDGLLRMGGRLRRSSLPPESKHPIILPHNHPNKILDHQSQKHGEEDDPFMPGMSQSRCATLEIHQTEICMTARKQYFNDIMPIFLNCNLVEKILQSVVDNCNALKYHFDAVVALEARGFLFGPLIALKMKLPFIPIRKHGKLPGKRITISYEKEYGLDIFEMQEDNLLQKDANVLLFDDILATGGNLYLIEKSGATVSCAIFLAELTYLNGKQMLKNTPYYSIIQFHE